MKKMLFAFCLMMMGLVSAQEINIQIVYDCSGSMGGRVFVGKNQSEQKALVARGAFVKIVGMIEKFQTEIPAADIKVGIVSFRGGNDGVILPLQKFDSSSLKKAIRNLPESGGNTPLGKALNSAYKGLPATGRSHIFVLTDGEENGPLKMADVIGDKKGLASLYFVAFDVSNKLFKEVKDLGAMVVEANNGEELNVRVQTIFTNNILLEKED